MLDNLFAAYTCNVNFLFVCVWWRLLRHKLCRVAAFIDLFVSFTTLGVFDLYRCMQAPADMVL